ncbi:MULTISPECIES: class IV lanthionine synthetase LanL [unclassified Streptomyces]
MGDEFTATDATMLVGCVRSVLEHHGLRDWNMVAKGFWCYVQPPGDISRVQGWKLHLSATPLSAPLVLARAADVLVQHRCHFKFARTIDHVTELVSRQCDRGSAGKIITVYPEVDDDGLRALAAELDRATEGLPGPVVLSDRPFRQGSSVHYRFGVFHGVPMLGNDGQYEAMLVAPDGALVLDRRTARFSPPDWGPRDPFTHARNHSQTSQTGPGSVAAPRPVLLKDRYLVRTSVRQLCTGGVYRALDQQTGAAVIVKQARQHTQATTTGGDVRDMRRHEAEMLRQFASSGVTPLLVDLFEQQGDLFLVQEEITGVTLRRWVSDNTSFHDDGTWGTALDAVQRIASELTDLVELVHSQGLVLRDLNPGNVMVTDDGSLGLIDLELLVRSGARPVVRGYTPGYAAPEQTVAPRIGTAPPPTADLYSLGATLFHLISGADPLLPDDDPGTRSHHERIAYWLDQLGAGNPGVRRFGDVVLALMHEDPGRRPGLARVRHLLAARTDPTDQDGRARSIPPLPDTSGVKRMLIDTLDHLLATMDTGSSERLWPTGASGATSDPCNVQHGAAGILGTLTLAYRNRPDTALRDAMTVTAGWIRHRAAREPRALPGLYFGRSGTAWALAEAASALGDDDLLAFAGDLARTVPVRWPNPDVCHGVAGAGLTQLRFWEITGEETYLDRAGQAAEAMAAAAEQQDGLVLWPVPRHFSSRLAGAAHFGFAHGVAGAGTFLLSAGQITGERAYLELAARAADSLRAVVQVRDGAAYWPKDARGDNPDRQWTHWCSGSSGVGTFLVRMWQENGDRCLLDLAALAAGAVHRARWQAGTTQCHGISGDGEFLLDLAAMTGEERYRDWAADLATALLARHTLRDGRMLPPDETATGLAADFGTGIAGVLAFLLRLVHGGPRLWLPHHGIRAAGAGVGFGGTETQET